MIQRVGEDGEQLTLLYVAGGKAKRAATQDGSTQAVSYKIKHRLYNPATSLLGDFYVP